MLASWAWSKALIAILFYRFPNYSGSPEPFFPLCLARRLFVGNDFTFSQLAWSAIMRREHLTPLKTNLFAAQGPSFRTVSFSQKNRSSFKSPRERLCSILTLIILRQQLDRASAARNVLTEQEGNWYTSAGPSGPERARSVHYLSY